MPSSRARRRRAQQRRGAGAQAPPRRSTGARPQEPASVEEVQSLEPVREQAEADLVDGQPDAVFEEPVDEEPVEIADEADRDELDRWDEPRGGDEDETLEEQEADVEEAAAELDPDGEEPAPRRRNPQRVAADRSRSATRSSSRNRRRGAAPQPQGPALVRFFRETFDELRKVDWPSPSELYRYTVIVIITVIVLAAFISGLDWVLQQLAQRFIYGASTG